MVRVPTKQSFGNFDVFLRTTRCANINGCALKGFPLLLSSRYEVDWLSLEYFIELERHSAVSSIRLYASHLNDFLSQVAVDGSSVDAISDNWLTAYKRALTKRENSSGIRNSENYASQVLRTVIHYLYWLEENKYIRGVVGENKRNKVRIKKTPRGIRHPLSNERKPTQKQSVTPRGEWIAAVKAYGPMREDLAIRFELMIDWGRSAGLRAKEICYLKVNQMPLRKTAERALVEGRNVYVDLRITKGGKPAKIPVSPLLIQKTWDYIDIFRVDVVSFFSQKAKRKYEVYEDPGLIFLSSKTGRSISAYSRPRLPLIPDEACHPFHAKAATDSTAKLPPRQAA